MALRCGVMALPASFPRHVEWRRISSRAREVKDWVDGVVLQHGFCRRAQPLRCGKRWSILLGKKWKFSWETFF